MTSRTLRTLRKRWLSAAAGAGIALGVLGLLFGAASLSRAAPLSPLDPGIPDYIGSAAIVSSTNLSAATSTGPGISGPLNLSPSTSTSNPSSTTSPVYNYPNTLNSNGNLATTTNSTNYATSSPTTAPFIAAEPSSAPMPMVVRISDDGNALIRGIVRTLGPTSLTLATWGGTWTINTTAMTRVNAGGTMINSSQALTNITPGDFIGAYGVVSPTKTQTVNAANLRDWTKRPPSSPSSEETATSTAPAVGAATNTLPSTTTPTDGTVPRAAASTATSSTPTGLPAGETLFTGRATNVTSSGFMLTTPSGKTYVVNVGPRTTVWNVHRQPMRLSGFSNEDYVRIDGTLSGASAINASVVRNTAR